MFKYIIILVLNLTIFLPANAGFGLIEIPKDEESGSITLFYPTNHSGIQINRNGFNFQAAENSEIAPTNNHLIVISHGSPASPWVYLSLTQLLVSNGFVVAIPEHEGDNYKNNSDSGIISWKRRPLEISKAITKLSRIDFLKNSIDFNKVGMYGMSAGGHTALTLAGGKWSPSKLLEHCQKNMAEDFYACSGPFINQDSGAWGTFKNKIIQWILSFKLSDNQWYSHTDQRIASIMAGVPFAADFDVETLKNPVTRLGLINAKQDIWLQPKYHISPIIVSCQTCDVFEIATGGHGSLLSPLPEITSSSISRLIKDPLDFHRSTEIPKINLKITNFFLETLHIQ